MCICVCVFGNEMNNNGNNNNNTSSGKWCRSSDPHNSAWNTEEHKMEADDEIETHREKKNMSTNNNKTKRRKCRIL